MVRNGFTPRGAFTLVELLVTIAIISILAVALMIGVYASQESARVSASTSRVKALADVIGRRYGEFETRPIPVPLENVCSEAGLDPGSAADRAVARLLIKRELMRLELPERFTDIISAPKYLVRSDGQTFRTSFSQYLLSRFNNYRDGRALTEIEQYESAECLYLIVTGTVYGKEMFAARHRGDADGDGLPEFHDGWGQPIMFLRWAPGASTNLTPDLGGTEQVSYSSVQQVKITNGIAMPHDALDPMMVDTDACQMWPLVYSPGSDGKAGINFRNGFEYALQENDPMASVADGPTGMIGAPLLRKLDDGDEPRGQYFADGSTYYVPTGEHLDNITNHSSLVE